MFSSLLSRSVVGCSRTNARRFGHTVRVILTQDLEGGEGYAGDVVRVKAGYARNHLIPQNKALYAIPQNFERLDMKDPDSETVEERRARLQQEKNLAEEGGEELKQADLLKYYLRNKVLKIWRRVDPNTNDVHPGMVDEKAVRAKLSKQLKIDLEPHEKVHLRPIPLVDPDVTGEELEALMEEVATEEACKVQIKALGLYLAKISLAGGYTVPLKVEVLKR